jgi:hydrogenase maturation protein HypF
MDYRPDRAVQTIAFVTRRVRHRFSGIVQGVGFRPFIYRLAVSSGLAGFVHNSSEGVIVEVEGGVQSLEAFLVRVRQEVPPQAEIYEITSSEIPAQGQREFRIIQSALSGISDVQISPDIATCDDCLAELFDPSDRRHKYPFINCTNCGPRLTIIKDIPYDRERTSMSVFPLCAQCRGEYEDPANRRFHAEPNACPVCGPGLKLLDDKGKMVQAQDVLAEATKRIKAGSILAIKGLGGFHLCVDAVNDGALQRLRDRKYREEKPLAIMVRDINQAEAVAYVSHEERELLLSPSRPVVLLKARQDSPISPLVAPYMRTLGIMLPYTPLHHLILEADFTALVMTSANQTDEPICIDNDEVVKRLAGIADAFVVHNRQIVVRCDDSVAMVARNKPYLLRRSRGYAPKPVLLKHALPDVLALGPHLKATVCIVKGGMAYLSPHIGDLETPLARDFLHETIERMQHITQCAPRIVACDMHPQYYSTRVASMLGAREVIRVQHHHAHIVSCMAENRITGKVIGLAMDGTGYGEDGRIWGGEFLIADEAGFERSGHLRYLPLLGGEAAIKQPWRFGISLLREAFGDTWPDVASRLEIVPEGYLCEHLNKIMDAGMNSPLTSSLGRVFDGVASIIDLKRFVSFEGQAAMELEAAAKPGSADVLPYRIFQEGETSILDLIPLVKAIVEARLAGMQAPGLASAFHATLIASFIDMAGLLRERTGISRVALSGGCFQNRILLEGCADELVRGGFEVFTHQRIPANDGGVALGQAVIAGMRKAHIL